MSPVNETGEPLAWLDEVGEIHTYKYLRQILSSNIVRLNDWFNGLAKENQENVQIKLYKKIPTASILLIDKNRESGSIRVEPILHNFPPNERPAFTVTRSSSFELYNKLVDSFNDMLEKGLDISEVIKYLDKSS